MNDKLNLNEKVQKDFLNYANAVIKSRAISSVEDNLKPVHRRILFTMARKKLWSDKQTLKCANVIGGVMVFHPHGDSSIYDALIRLSQDWKMRYPLIEIQGNNGNIMGDGAAASRYTECRLTKIGELMLDGIDKGAISFKDNYDETEKEPVILPSVFPNLLCNGNSGIAVGLSSNLVPHNFTEVATAITAVLNNKDISVEKLHEIIKGPDFPTGGTIIDAEKLKEIYSTGNGTVTIRSKYKIENLGNKQQIIITEIPYGVNMEEGIIEPLKKLVIEENFDLIEDFQNETNKNGIALKIVLKKGANIYKVLETLWSKTRLQITQKINNTVIVNGNPKVLNLKEMIEHYIFHRQTCIKNIAAFELEKIKSKIFVTEAMILALGKIDDVIVIIKEADDKNDALIKLMSFLNITNFQAEAILDMKLSKLSKLDKKELDKSLQDFLQKKKELQDVVQNILTRKEIIKKELLSLANSINDKRRTIIGYSNETSVEGTEPVHKIQVIIFKNGEIYPTRQKFKDMKKTFGPISSVIETYNDKKIIFFTSDGLIFNQNMLTLQQENLTMIASNIITGFDLNNTNKKYLVAVNTSGIVKKSLVSEYLTAKNASGFIKLKENDSVMYVALADDEDFLLLLSEDGNKLVKFKVKEIVATGKMTIGSKGINCAPRAACIAAYGDKVFSINDLNQAKFTLCEDYLDTMKNGTGQIITENTIYIGNIKNDTIAIFVDKKNVFIDINKLAIKSKTAVGSKLLNGKVISFQI